MHITAKELNPHDYPTDGEVAANLAVLLDRLNQVRDAYGQPMIINSGLRSQSDQSRINPSAPKSKHLIGAAADINDPDGKFYDWCRANEALLVKIGFWMETRQGGWQHLQIFPPKSGNRWFIP